MSEACGKEERRYSRIETNVKVKLKDDQVWTECPNANVSGCGLVFDTPTKLNVGEFDPLQFMLQSNYGTSANMLFFATGRVVRSEPHEGLFRTAVEFIIDADVRSEILRVLNIIKCQKLIVNRSTAGDAGPKECIP